MTESAAAPALAIEWWALDRPKPYPGNARKISSRAVSVVAKSLREYGWRQPIVVDRDGVIIAGHTRLQAAQALGLASVPVHIAESLTPAQAAAYRLMDNRSADETEWDLDLLAVEMAALNLGEYDLALTGFESREITEILARASVGKTDAEDVPEVPVTPVARLGDLWLLGPHRLLCGDSTSLKAVAALMGTDKADMVFTDPPYNVDYDPAERSKPATSEKRMAQPFGTISNDKKAPEEFRAFLDLVYQALDSGLKAGRSLYICHADVEGHHFRNAFLAMPWKLQSCLIWQKTVMALGHADYHWQHDPILYGWKEGAPHMWHGDRCQTTILEVATDRLAPSLCDTGGEYVHPMQKPVALIERALTNSSLAEETILDTFGGSGSTLIACQKMGRRARLLELDPRYVDVIVTRWQNYTGQAATLASDGRTFAEVTPERLAR